MADDFRNLPPSWANPAQNLVSVAPSDSVNFTHECRALFVGTGGNVAVLAVNDSSAVVLKNIPDGSIIPVRTLRVNSTNTTASDIVALY